MIDLSSGEVYFEEMRIPLAEYLALVWETRCVEELRLALAVWKRLSETEAGGRTDREVCPT
jgi:hypothetical protein